MVTLIIFAALIAAWFAIKLVWVCITAPFRVARDIANMKREKKLREQGYIIIREQPKVYYDEFDWWQDNQGF